MCRLPEMAVLLNRLCGLNMQRPSSEHAKLTQTIPQTRAALAQGPALSWNGQSGNINSSEQGHNMTQNQVESEF